MSLLVQTNPRVLEISADDDGVMTITDSATMKTYHYKPKRMPGLFLSDLDMENLRLVSIDGGSLTERTIPKEEYHLYAYRIPSCTTDK